MVMSQSRNQSRNQTRNHRRRCPPGYTHRKSYTRKNTGTHVKGTCIRSTSPYRNNPSASNKLRRMTLSARLARRGKTSGTRKRCPPGTIARSAYVRRISTNIAKKGYVKRTRAGKLIRVYPKSKSVYVSSACVEDTGKPGKLPEGAPRIGPLRKGELAKHGYSYKLPENARRIALQKAVQEYGALDTYRKLNAVSKLTLRTSPGASKTFSQDRNWIRRTYGQGGVVKAF
jgi:hypothetical protein